MLDRRKECEHAIFDETWGEYKCAYHKVKIYKSQGCKGCEHYQKRKGEMKTCKPKD